MLLGDVLVEEILEEPFVALLDNYRHLLDASVEAEDAWAYEEDLDQMQMVAAQ